MINQNAKELANNILKDRQGADYYNNPEVLASYLKSSLNVSEETSQRLAKDICTDRNGADYYKDVEILSTYLAGAA